MPNKLLDRSERHHLLCQIDGHICRSFGLSNPDVKEFVGLISQEDYQALKNSSSIVKRTHNLLKKDYHQMKVENCSLRADSFGGYGLHYEGEKLFPKGQQISLFGYLEKIPKKDESTFSNLSIMAPREGSGLSRVMVGPARFFLNHSCVPNCDYVAIEINGRKAVQIITRQEIPPQTELLSFYGASFFGPGNRDCLCVHTNLHVDISTPVLSTTRTQIELSPIAAGSPLALQRIQGMFRMRNFKRKYRQPAVQSTHKKTCWVDLRLVDAEVSDSDVSSETEMTTVVGDNDFANEGLSNASHDSSNVFFSSSNDCENPARVASEESSSSEKEEVEAFQLIYGNSKTSLDNFVHCVESIVTKHGTSDKEAGEWLRLIRLSYPDCTIPSFKNLKNRNARIARQRILKSEELAGGEGRVLIFVEEIEMLLKLNFTHIVNYNANKGNGRDLILPDAFDRISNKLKVFLILNTDGVKVIQSRNNTLWPVWIAVANLPPILRSAFKNIILAGLWFGKEKPQWTSFFKVIVCVLIFYSSHVKFFFQFFFAGYW